jgi:S1/P1 Nuclease
MRLLGASRLLPLCIAVLWLAPSADAWGCKGHEVIALVAEQHLNPHAKAITFGILGDWPANGNLPRYCRATGDPLADASTWADDERQVRPETAAWHYIDLPRGASESDLARYCPAPEGCILSALTEQLRILRDRSAGPAARADALRFLIHFVGDIHQPLHAITNNDLGGNCVPVTFFGQRPEESPARRGSFHPNLHSIWDTDILERMSPGQSPSDVAKDLETKFRSGISRWQAQPPSFAAWAWESHELAERVAYGQLPHPIPIEAPRRVTTCAEVAGRMLRLDENLADPYQNAAAPVVDEQLAKAGARLAALLNSL